MVLAVQYGVAVRVQIRATLRHEREQVEEALPALVHAEHAVRAVAVQEERLAKNAEKPVSEEKNYDGNHDALLVREQ
jgi:hypothetical protein